MVLGTGACIGIGTLLHSEHLAFPHLYYRYRYVTLESRILKAVDSHTFCLRNESL